MARDDRQVDLLARQVQRRIARVEAALSTLEGLERRVADVETRLAVLLARMPKP